MNHRRPQLRTSPSSALTQRLALTPALLQKIELLTLSKVELEEMLTRELAENPVLEESADSDGKEKGLIPCRRGIRHVCGIGLL
jgi:DNA-directed RNA polymerase specialized sigma54-like protein